VQKKRFSLFLYDENAVLYVECNWDFLVSRPVEFSQNGIADSHKVILIHEAIDWESKLFRLGCLLLRGLSFLLFLLDFWLGWGSFFLL